jgi:MYXO-CTERM domain-containing protein
MGPTLNEPRESFVLTAFGNSVTASGGCDTTVSEGIDVTASVEVLRFGQPNGMACTAGGPCESGFCSGGVCCDAACTGACTACTAQLKGTGKDGSCGPVEKGTDPGNWCDDQGPGTCGTNGLCDGAGACESYVDGTVCQIMVDTPCVVAVCAGGTCGGRHKLDGSPCTGGVCVAGVCLPDEGLPDGGSSSSSSGVTSATSASGTGGAAGAGSSGAGGEGGQASGEITGSGCGVAAGTGPRGGAAALVLGLLGLLLGKRRRG